MKRTGFIYFATGDDWDGLAVKIGFTENLERRAFQLKMSVFCVMRGTYDTETRLHRLMRDVLDVPRSRGREYYVAAPAMAVIQSGRLFEELDAREESGPCRYMMWRAA